MKKEAKFPWETLITATVGSVLAIGVGAFADEIVDWLKENRQQSKGKEYFKEMLKAHPSLKKEEPQLVAKYWASLFHFAPHMAADPLSSGAFIRQSIDRGYPDLYGGPPVDTYSTLAGIEKAHADSSPKGRSTASELSLGMGTKFLTEGVGTGLYLGQGETIKREKELAFKEKNKDRLLKIKDLEKGGSYREVIKVATQAVTRV